MDLTRSGAFWGGCVWCATLEVCTEDVGFSGASGVVELDATAEVGLDTAGVMTSISWSLLLSACTGNPILSPV